MADGYGWVFMSVIMLITIPALVYATASYFDIVGVADNSTRTWDSTMQDLYDDIGNLSDVSVFGITIIPNPAKPILVSIVFLLDHTVGIIIGPVFDFAVGYVTLTGAIVSVVGVPLLPVLILQIIFTIIPLLVLVKHLPTT